MPKEGDLSQLDLPTAPILIQVPTVPLQRDQEVNQSATVMPKVLPPSGTSGKGPTPQKAKPPLRPPSLRLRLRSPKTPEGSKLGSSLTPVKKTPSKPSRAPRDQQLLSTPSPIRLSPSPSSGPKRVSPTLSPPRASPQRVHRASGLPVSPGEAEGSPLRKTETCREAEASTGASACREAIAASTSGQVPRPRGRPRKDRGKIKIKQVIHKSKVKSTANISNKRITRTMAGKVIRQPQRYGIDEFVYPTLNKPKRSVPDASIAANASSPAAHGRRRKLSPSLRSRSSEGENRRVKQARLKGKGKAEIQPQATPPKSRSSSNSPNREEQEALLQSTEQQFGPEDREAWAQLELDLYYRRLVEEHGPEEADRLFARHLARKRSRYSSSDEDFKVPEGKVRVTDPKTNFTSKSQVKIPSGYIEGTVRDSGSSDPESDLYSLFPNHGFDNSESIKDHWNPEGWEPLQLNDLIESNDGLGELADLFPPTYGGDLRH